MKIVVSALHFPWDNLPECLDKARQWGIDGVELSWAHGFARPHCTRDDLEDLRRLNQDGNCLLVSHIWDDLAQLGSTAGGNVLRGWLELCRPCRVSGLVIHGGTWPDRAEGVARMRQVLEGVLGDFERAGVVLYLENHYAYEYHHSQELFSEPWEFRQVLSLDSPSLRFCFDTGHGHMTKNWPALLTQLAPWLGHVHLADNHGVDDNHCMFGQGTVPWGEMLPAIREVGFDGTFCVEFPVREDLRPFGQCLARLRAIWGQFDPPSDSAAVPARQPASPDPSAGRGR